MAYVVQRQYSINGFLFHQTLNAEHELIRLAEKIDWEEISYRLLKFYKVRGRQSKSIRLMVGLQLLKHRFNLSDEAVVAQLHENVYWQAFCSVEWPVETDESGKIQKTILVESSVLTKFRKRIGTEGVELIEGALREQMIQEKVISTRTAIFDTTAQEKNIAYPLDTHLLHRGRGRMIQLIRRAKEMGVSVPKGLRSFERKSRQVLITLVKLGKDRMERIEHGTKELISYTRHVAKRVPKVTRAIGRKINGEPVAKTEEKLKRLGRELTETAKKVARVIAQAGERFKGVHLKNKIYSLHEPQVVCIRKGKRSRENEYGSKVSLTIDRSGYVVTHQEAAGNPSDVTLLKPALVSWEEATGSLPSEVVADRGVTPKRGKAPRILSRIKRVALPSRGKRRRAEESKSWFKRLLKKRVIIEPIISHLKSDHRMNRCRYKGFAGDQINVAWAVMAWNIKKWVRDTG